MNYTSRTPGVCRSITKLWFVRCGVHGGTGEKEGTVGIAVGNDDIEMPLITRRICQLNSIAYIGPNSWIILLRWWYSS